MDISKRGAAIIRNIMGNRNMLLIFVLLGVLLLVIAIPDEREESPGIYETKKEEEGSLEKKLERILKNTEGVGEVRVMITKGETKGEFLEEEKESGAVEGVVVVAEGAENPAVRKKIQDIVVALFPIEVHKIEIAKMKAD